MWTIQDQSEQEAVNESELLIGHCVAGGHDWVCRASGGTDGISLGDPDSLLHVSVRSGNQPADGLANLPVAAERFVRGDEWKIHYPQSSGDFSLRMSIRIVEATKNRLVLEPTFAIQTSLLDAHPMLAVQAVGGRVAQTRLNVEPPSQDAVDHGEVSVASLDLQGEAGSITILLGPRDAPFTTNSSSADRLDFQLFGEFLEKGVIRKARPWIILDRVEPTIAESELQGYAERLCQTPLPLTP